MGKMYYSFNLCSLNLVLEFESSQTQNVSVFCVNLMVELKENICM
jgi:hypothetical protein